jgi:APA family basic amino acid/polyamine antiporter
MSDSHSGLRQSIGLRSATALVVANVIGAGIFTTTGFQAADLGDPRWIFLLWVLGGVLAYCGALCYGELGAAMPHAGAEYVYLRETYGRAFGFMSAFVSLIAGFPAPIAAALKSLMHYLSAFFPAFEGDLVLFGGLHLKDAVAVAAVWALVAIQLRGQREAIGFNNLATLLKVAGIVAIILAAATVGQGDTANFNYVSASYATMDGAALMTALATSLIFVMFCYSGWNAAAYVASEIIEPQRNLPRALLTGTVIVTVLYLGLNVVYLYGANVDQLAGKVEVGLVAARELFGAWGAGLVTAVLAVSLLASASAMTIAGPRVYYALGRDVSTFGFLAVTTRSGVPINALLVQATVASLFIVSGRVDQILQYAGFTLALMSALAVSCVIVLRFRRPDMARPFRTWAYPFPPLFYLTVTGWTMVWAFRGRPLESSLALLTVAAGGALFYAGEWLRRRRAG